MRKRMISPEFWTDSKIVKLSMSARVLFIGLWQYADDEGLFIEDLINIKMVLFPDQDVNLQKTYEELKQFFRFGKLPDGRVVVQILHFRDYQRLNRPTPSKLVGIQWDNSVSVSNAPVMPAGQKRKSQKSDPAFKEFYEAYPRHEARADAEKAWLKLNPDSQLLATINEAVKLYADYSRGKEQKFIALPATWLNGKRWEDDLRSNVNGEEELPAIWQPIESQQTHKE